MTTLGDIAELVRAPAALSVPGDTLAGATVTGTLGARAAGLSAAAVCLYWAGMAANDWADRELDAAERPERPIPSGRVAPAAALGVATALTATGLGLAGLVGGRRALAVAAPLAGLAWWYDLTLKDTPAGPAAMAACRGLDVLLGASAGNAGKWRRAAMPALTVAAHTYTVTALSRREVTGGGPLLPGATLLGTIAVAASAAAPAAASLPAALAAASPAAVLAAVAPAAGPGSLRERVRRLLPAALAAWYTVGYGVAQARAVAEPDASHMRAAVREGITNLAALQGALIARSGAPATGTAVAWAAPLGRALSKRLSPT